MHQVEVADRDHGFTLIELLVVMIIIGILAAIAIPTFLSQRQNAIGSSQVADLRSVGNEIEGFFVDRTQYPTSFVQAGGEVTLALPPSIGTQRVTVGNSLTYTLNATADAYCLIAVNPKASGPRVWISNAGGLQPASVSACPF